MCLCVNKRSETLLTQMTKVAKIATLLSIYSYIRQVQYFLPLPSSASCPLSPTKDGDRLNWRPWWIAFEVRSLCRCTGFIPAQSSFQDWIDSPKSCKDQSIIRWRVREWWWEQGRPPDRRAPWKETGNRPAPPRTFISKLIQFRFVGALWVFVIN